MPQSRARSEGLSTQRRRPFLHSGGHRPAQRLLAYCWYASPHPEAGGRALATTRRGGTSYGRIPQRQAHRDLRRPVLRPGEDVKAQAGDDRKPRAPRRQAVAQTVGRRLRRGEGSSARCSLRRRTAGPGSVCATSPAAGRRSLIAEVRASMGLHRESAGWAEPPQREEVEHHPVVEPALGGRDVGHVGHPHAVRHLGLEDSVEHVGRDGRERCRRRRVSLRVTARTPRWRTSRATRFFP